MSIIDPKLRKYLFQFIFQSFLVALSIGVVLFFLNIFTDAAIITALGATTYIIFTKPNSIYAKGRHFLGGYFVGIVVGIMMKVPCNIPAISHIFPKKEHIIIAAALAVAFSMFLMNITDTEHAPAAGMALALVLNPWDARTIFIIIISVLILYAAKRLFEPIMHDLA